MNYNVIIKTALMEPKRTSYKDTILHIVNHCCFYYKKAKIYDIVIQENNNTIRFVFPFIMVTYYKSLSDLNNQTNLQKRSYLLFPIKKYLQNEKNNLYWAQARWLHTIWINGEPHLNNSKILRQNLEIAVDYILREKNND